jgi:hypothetical protein
VKLLVYVPLAGHPGAQIGDARADERRLVELSFLRNLMRQAQAWLERDTGRELVLRSTDGGLIVEARPLGAQAAVAAATELEAALGAALEEQIGRDFAARAAQNSG